MTEVLLDTSALVEFFEGTECGAHVCAAIEQDIAATTFISLAELNDVLTRKGVDAQRQLSFLQQHVRMLPLTFESSVAAAKVKQKQRKKQPSFGIIDALTYCVAQEHSLILLTKDIDFAGLDGVRIL